MIWIIHFIIISFLLFVSKILKKDNFFVKSSFIYAVFVFGQRWMTGTDFPYYLQYYLVEFHGVEPFYYALQQFLVQYNLYFGILIFIIFFITLFNNYRFILKVNHQVILIIFFFLLSETFAAQMSQIRQFVAVSFFMNSYYYMFHNHYKKSFINILLGLMFHESIIFLVPFLFLRLKLDKVRMLYLLILSAVLPLVDITPILQLPFFDRYSSYVDSVFNVNLSSFHYLKFYIILGVMILFVWYIDKININNRIEQMIVNGLIFNMIIYSMSFQFAIMLRLSMYFKIFEIIFLVYYYKRLSGFSAKTIKTAVVILLLGVFSGLALTDPYQVASYQFSPLRLRETRTHAQLRQEIRVFLDNK